MSHSQHQVFNEDPILLDIPAPILTPRLILKPPQFGEGKLIAEAVKETWTDLNTWEDWAVSPEENATEEYWELKTRKAAAQFILRESLEFRSYCRATGKFIGITDICYPNWRVRSFIIGYWIRESEQAKGYATEASNALLRYAFGALSALYVGLGHAEGNDASAKVINRLGFQSIGARPNILALADGRIVGDKLYYRDSLQGLPDLDVSWG